MNGAILGLNRKEMQMRFDKIAAFAEIGDFIDQPVKTYSSGMFMRLAFAVAVNVDPDILLVDEALAVGDLIFQHRCMHRMNQLRDIGRAIVLVTHDLDAVTKFCDRAILLDGGLILEDGKSEIVVQKYRALIFERERGRGGFDGSVGPQIGADLLTSMDNMPVARSIPNIDHRFGSTEAAVLGVEMLDGNGNVIQGGRLRRTADHHSCFGSIPSGCRSADYWLYSAESAGNRDFGQQHFRCRSTAATRTKRSDFHQ